MNTDLRRSNKSNVNLNEHIVLFIHEVCRMNGGDRFSKLTF